MANMTENQLDALIPATAYTAIVNGIIAARTNLPKGGTFTLTKDRMDKMLSMDVDNRVLVQKALEEVTNFGAAVLPPYFSAAKIGNDKGLFEQLEALEGMVDNLQLLITYLKRQAAHEAVAGAIAAYQMFKAAAMAGIPEAQGPYERLRERFEKGSSGGGTAPATMPDPE